MGFLDLVKEEEMGEDDGGREEMGWRGTGEFCRHMERAGAYEIENRHSLPLDLFFLFPLFIP